MPQDRPFDYGWWNGHDNPLAFTGEALDTYSSGRCAIVPADYSYDPPGAGFSQDIENRLPLFDDCVTYQCSQGEDYGSLSATPTQRNVDNGRNCINPSLIGLNSNGASRPHSPPFVISNHEPIDSQHYQPYSPATAYSRETLPSSISPYTATTGATASNVGLSYYSDLQYLPFSTEFQTSMPVSQENISDTTAFIAQPKNEESYHEQEILQVPPTGKTARRYTPPLPRPSRVPRPYCIELKCQRRQQGGSQYCKRHTQKRDRRIAPAPQFQLDNDIILGPFENAIQHVFPVLQPLNLPNDDVPSRFESKQVVDLVKAVQKVYTHGSDYHGFHARQQKVLNGKWHDGAFDNLTVNVRMRYLYEAARTFHTGGRVIYPIGGDNEGYGNPDKTLIFSKRLETIIAILERDKRVCLDVIEGRGVTALVENPEKYARRKTQNKDSNERKQKMQKLGDKAQEKMKAKVKDYEGSDSDRDDDIVADDEEEVENNVPATPISIPASVGNTLGTDPGPQPRRRPMGTKRKRVTPSMDEVPDLVTDYGSGTEVDMQPIDATRMHLTRSPPA